MATAVQTRRLPRTVPVMMTRQAVNVRAVRHPTPESPSVVDSLETSGLPSSDTFKSMPLLVLDVFTYKTPGCQADSMVYYLFVISRTVPYYAHARSLISINVSHNTRSVKLDMIYLMSDNTIYLLVNGAGGNRRCGSFGATPVFFLHIFFRHGFKIKDVMMYESLLGYN